MTATARALVWNKEIEDWLIAGRIGSEDMDAAMKSAVRAVLPGRQQKGNLGPYVELARKAFLRTLRRRAK